MAKKINVAVSHRCRDRRVSGSILTCSCTSSCA